jgi:hypothetical protein
MGLPKSAVAWRTDSTSNAPIIASQAASRSGEGVGAVVWSILTPEFGIRAQRLGVMAVAIATRVGGYDGGGGAMAVAAAAGRGSGAPPGGVKRAAVPAHKPHASYPPTLVCAGPLQNAQRLKTVGWHDAHPSVLPHAVTAPQSAHRGAEGERHAAVAAHRSAANVCFPGRYRTEQLPLHVAASVAMRLLQTEHRWRATNESKRTLGNVYHVAARPRPPRRRSRSNFSLDKTASNSASCASFKWATAAKRGGGYQVRSGAGGGDGCGEPCSLNSLSERGVLAS